MHKKGWKKYLHHIIYFCCAGLAIIWWARLIMVDAIPVPFIAQAPFGNWSQPWQDACEETSIIMVDAFYHGIPLDRQISKKNILKLLKIKNKVYGKSLDENAEKIIGLINNFYPWEAFIFENPTIEDIKKELDAGFPVIAPLYGRALKNPYFKGGGPLYHVLVIADYDEGRQEFITNEPGTQRGEEYRYSYDVIMNALHDYLPNKKTMYGKKVAIFTRPTLSFSSIYDGDNDGLTKQIEIVAGTSLMSHDTDNDGYSDADEIEAGYSPLISASKIM